MQSQRGSVLVFVTLTVAVLMIVGVTFATATTSEYRAAMHHTHSTQAFYVAEAGLNWARHALEQGSLVLPTGVSVGHEHISYQSAAFGGTHTALASIGELRVAFVRTASGWALSSQGAQQITRRTLGLTVTEQVAAGATGVLDRHQVGSSITLTGSASIIGDVTAGSVELTGNPRLTGDVEIVGTTLAGKVSAPPGAISGPISLVPSAVSFAPPNLTDRLPSDLVWRGNFTAGWWPVPPYTLPGTGHYGTIDVQSELLINVPSAADVVIRVNELRVTGSGRITITGSGTGRVVFHVERALRLSGSGTINNGGSSDKVDVFYYGSEDIDVAGDTRLVGSLVAATADIDISGSAGITGHILTGGSSVRVTGDADAHVRVLYAPNAQVRLTGSGSLSGVVVARSLEGTGATTLIINTGTLTQFERFATGLNLWSGTRVFTFSNWGYR